MKRYGTPNQQQSNSPNLAGVPAQAFGAVNPVPSISLDASPLTKTLQYGAEVFLGKYEQEQKKKEAEMKALQSQKDNIWVLQQTTSIQDEALKELTNGKLTIDAGSDDFSKKMMEKFDERFNPILETAPTPEAKLRLQANLLQQRSNFFENSFNYEVSVKTNKQKVDLENSINSLKTTTYLNPETMQGNIDLILNTLPNLTYIPESSKQELASKIKNDLAEANVEGTLNNVLNKAIAKEITDEQAISELSELNNSLNSEEFASLFTQEKLDALSGETLSKVSFFQNKIAQQQQQILERKTREISEQFEDHISSIQNTGVGVISREEVKFLAEKTGDDSILRKYDTATNEAKKIFNVLTEIETDDPNKMIGLLSAYKPTPGDVNFADKQKTYEIAQKAVQKKIEDYNKDPAEAAIKNKEVQAAYKQSPANGVRTSIAYQEKMGIPLYNTRIFTKEQSADMVKRLSMLAPDQLEGALLDISKTYSGKLSNGSSLYNKAMGELTQAGLPSYYSIIATNVGKPVANDLVYASKQAKELNSLDIKGVKQIDIENAVKNELFNFNNVFYKKGGMAVSQVKAVNDSTMLLAKYYMVTQGISKKEAAKKATKLIVNDNYNFLNVNNSLVAVPKTFDSNKVSSQLHNLQTKQSIEQFINKGGVPIFNIPSSGKPGKITPEQAIERTLKHEGGKAIDSNGAKVNYGINQAFYNPPEGFPKDVFKLTKEQAVSYYKQKYWQESWNKEGYSDEYKMFLFDAAVQHGVGTADKFRKKSDGDLVKAKEERINHLKQWSTYSDKGGWSASKKQQTLPNLIGRVNSFKNMYQEVAGLSNKNISEKQVKELILNSKKTWVTNDDGMGATLHMIDSNGTLVPLRDQYGKTFSINYKEAEKSAQKSININPAAMRFGL